MAMKLICLTGAESTGKSSLALQLAGHFNTYSLAEYAREYLETFGPTYVYEDLSSMAKEQQRRILKFAKISKPIGFLDTDLLTLILWSKYVFGKVDPWLEEAFQQNKVDLYLLCKPDIAWKADPLREHPNEREQISSMYEDELQIRNLPYHVVQGEGEARLSSALNAIEKSKLF